MPSSSLQTSKNLTTKVVNSLINSKIFFLVSAKLLLSLFALPWMRDGIYLVTFPLLLWCSVRKKSTLPQSFFYVPPNTWHKIVWHSGKLCSCSSVRLREEIQVVFPTQVSSHICATCDTLPMIHLFQIHHEISSTYRSVRELELFTSSIGFWGIHLKLWQLHNTMASFWCIMDSNHHCWTERVTQH